MKKTICLIFFAACLMAVTSISPLSPVLAQQAGDKDNGAAVIKLRVATIPITYMVPLYAAQQKGFFAEERLDVEMVSFQGGAAMLSAMTAGEFAFGESSIVAAILAEAQGLDIKVIMGNTRTPAQPPDDQPTMVLKSSGITSLKQLEGKKVAINALKNHMWLAFREAVRKQGGDPDKITLLELPFPNMQDALINKQVDAVMMVEPFTTILLKGGKAEILSSPNSEVYPKLDNAVWVGNGKWIRRYPKETEGFVRAMTKAIDFLNKNADDRNKIIAGFTKLNVDLVKDLTIRTYSASIAKQPLQYLLDSMLREKLLQSPMNIETLLWDKAPIE